VIPTTIAQRSADSYQARQELENPAWLDAFLNGLAEDSRQLVAAVLKYEGGALLLALLSERARAANTVADLAYLVGTSEARLKPLLRWLHDQGVVESTKVEGTTFYRLTQDRQRRQQVHQFRCRRAEWLAELQRVTNWLEGA
jgi:hypothetical protein